ncbi:MAG: thiamine-phosphate kinase [Rhodospirillales bacterium]|nr:MAG: thiamine-phosphate kinase [Rhodospirillales bacterium]
MPARRSGEFELIDRFLRPLAAGFAGAAGLGDDTARIDVPAGESLVVTTDALVAGVHFLDRHDPGLIARKALRVNLSDLAAAGARPLAYQLALALPDSVDDDWIAAFCAGLALDQAEFAIHLSGGDTVSTPGPLTICVTAFGAVPSSQARGRGGAQPGDKVFVTGTIGDGALGLLAETGRLADIETAHRAYLADRYLLPRPRVAMGLVLRGRVTATMDVSDGLVADLGHICARSGVAAVVDADRVPLSAAAAAAVAADPSRLAVALTGGDDYELLFTAPRSAAAAIHEAARAADVPVAEIGVVEAGSGVRALRSGAEMRLASGGFTHR